MFDNKQMEAAYQLGVTLQVEAMKARRRAEGSAPLPFKFSHRFQEILLLSNKRNFRDRLKESMKYLDGHALDLALMQMSAGFWISSIGNQLDEKPWDAFRRSLRPERVR